MYRGRTLSFRLSEEELQSIKDKATKHGFRTHSELARFILLNLNDIKIDLKINELNN